MKKTIGLFLILLTACTPDRQFEAPTAAPPVGGNNDIREGTLRINEFMATGSPFFNELVLEGTASSGSDWLELFNTTYDTIYIEEGKWFVTDTLGDSEKWKLPDTLILPRGFLTIWCDGFDTTITQMHTSFKLSSSGEDLGLFYKNTDETSLKVDGFTYPSQFSGQSQARFPDGSLNWIFSFNPTPSLANEE